MNFKCHQEKLSEEKKRFIRTLEQSALANYLDHTQLQELLIHCGIMTFKKEHYIYQQGKHTHGLYIILKGNVHLIAKVLGQGIIKIDAMQAGDILGGIRFIDTEPSATSAIAKTNVTCLFINRINFVLLAHYYPETKYKLLEAISAHVCHRMKRTHDKAIQYISKVDMLGLSLIGRVIHSVTHPKKPSLSMELVRKKLWSNHSILKNFSDEEKALILAQTTLLEAPKNCILIHEDEKNPSCCIVLHGAVQSSIMQDNKLAKLSVIGPNSLFASVACVDRLSKFTITFITCESVVLLKLSEKELLYFQKEHPTLWYKLFELICGSLVALGKSINKLDIRLHIESYNR